MISPSFFISFCLAVLSAATLPPASDKPDPIDAQHAKRDLSLAHHLTLDNVTGLTPPPSSSNSTYSTDFSCFNLDHHNMKFIQPLDCYSALYKMLIAPDAMWLVQWNTHTPLPKQWVQQTCSILLDRTSDSSSDTFQPVLVAHAAALLVEKCVTARASYQGGKVSVGAGAEFMVYVSHSQASATA